MTSTTIVEICCYTDDGCRDRMGAFIRLASDAVINLPPSFQTRNPAGYNLRVGDEINHEFLFELADYLTALDSLFPSARLLE